MRLSRACSPTSIIRGLWALPRSVLWILSYGRLLAIPCTLFTVCRGLHISGFPPQTWIAGLCWSLLGLSSFTDHRYNLFHSSRSKNGCPRFDTKLLMVFRKSSTLSMKHWRQHSHQVPVCIALAMGWSSTLVTSTVCSRLLLSSVKGLEKSGMNFRPWELQCVINAEHSLSRRLVLWFKDWRSHISILTLRSSPVKESWLSQIPGIWWRIRPTHTQSSRVWWDRIKVIFHCRWSISA